MHGGAQRRRNETRLLAGCWKPRKSGPKRSGGLSPTLVVPKGPQRWVYGTLSAAMDGEAEACGVARLWIWRAVESGEANASSIWHMGVVGSRKRMGRVDGLLARFLDDRPYGDWLGRPWIALETEMRGDPRAAYEGANAVGGAAEIV